MIVVVVVRTYTSTTCVPVLPQLSAVTSLSNHADPNIAVKEEDQKPESIIASTSGIPKSQGL